MSAVKIIIKRAKGLGSSLCVNDNKWFCLASLIASLHLLEMSSSAKLEPSPLARFIMILTALTKALAKAYIKSPKSGDF